MGGTRSTRLTSARSTGQRGKTSLESPPKRHKGSSPSASERHQDEDDIFIELDDIESNGRPSPNENQPANTGKAHLRHFTEMM